MARKKRFPIHVSVDLSEAQAEFLKRIAEARHERNFSAGLRHCIAFTMEYEQP